MSLYDKFRGNKPDNNKQPSQNGSKLTGEIIERNGTRFLVSENSFPHEMLLPGRDIFDNKYTCSLDLLYGVRGKKTEKFLGKGMKTLYDAANTVEYKEEAGKILKALDKDFKCLHEIIASRHSSSHKLLFLLLSFFKKEDLLFVDIETKGLFFEAAIIMIGAGYFDKDKYVVKQFTILEDAAEAEILEEFAAMLKGKKAFVTFNGRTFDIPFIAQRMDYYGIACDTDILKMHNFDLLHFSRKAFRRKADDSCRLKELEARILDRKRKSDIDGAEVEMYYHSFLETGNADFINPIIYHNLLDIESLLLLANKLGEVWG